MGEALYFAFVTGLTIGYGDITPHTPIGQVLSLVIGLNGLVLTGLFVAAANRALVDTVQQHAAYKRKKMKKTPKC